MDSTMEAIRMLAAKRKAFSLVEVSIVLVILGLLAGGVLAGRSLINAQRLRAVGTDAVNYMTAMNQFKLKYSYVAGDFPTATEVWGTVGGGTGDCAAPDTTASVGDTTCNGDGNGYLTAGGHEPHRAWQQLAAAQFIVGVYTGVGPYALDVSAPKGKLEKAGYGWVGGLIQVNSALAVNPNYFDGDYTNMLSFGTVATIMDGAALKADEMAELDGKFDDALPATGGIRAYKSSASCVSGATAYNVSNATVACAPLFLSSFKAAK